MKIGLCLAGGGARGAYQIGALKALDELGLLSKVNAYSGTSIGSVNACLAATLPVDEIKDIWFQLTHDLLKKTEGIFEKLRKEKLEFKETGIFEIEELENLLKKHLNVAVLKTKEVYVTLAEGGMNHEGIIGLLKSSYQHFIKKDRKVIYAAVNHKSVDDLSIYKQIIASCSIPIAFAPTISDKHQYYDGGVYDNVPVRPLVDAHCDRVIVIHLSKLSLFDPKKFPNVIIDEIKPKHHLGGILNFDGEKSRKLFEYGYTDTIAYFNQLV